MAIDLEQFLDDVFVGGCWFKHCLFLLELLDELFFDFFDCALEVVGWDFLFRHAPKAFFAWVEIDVEHVA